MASALPSQRTLTTGLWGCEAGACD